MKLAVIGCGKMATALVNGMISEGLIIGSDVIGVARKEPTRKAFVNATGAMVTDDSNEAVRDADVVLLATKPKDIGMALANSGLGVIYNKLVVSVAAGVDLQELDRLTKGGCRIVRSMPNTPCLVKKGAVGYTMGDRCDEADKDLVKSMLEGVGLAIEVPERLLNAVTGLSGSGPAFVYLVIEALADGGVLAGLPRADAIRLAAQTVSGAAEMVLQTGEHTAILKDKVASPGGTTIEGLKVLEDGGVRSALIGAVRAAARRAEELGRG